MKVCNHFIFLINLFYLINAELGCRDNNGLIVDWFYLYKLPEGLANNGLSFVYITSNTTNDDWMLSNVQIDSPLSIPGRTLSPIYSKNLLNSVVLLYNDEPPEGKTDGTHGHTKGALVTDSKTGFWLIHSVPHYPSTQSYNYPSTGTRYGQSFFCITMKSDQMEFVGKQLIYNEPLIYSSNFPNYLKSLFPNLYNAALGNFNKVAPFYNLLTLSTINQITFTSFAKGKKFNKELYEDWVAPTLNTDLFAETWLHGTGKIDSDCTKKYHVWNIREINVTSINVTFSTEKDHSKWVASSSNDTDWICVGDINRALHQKQRGGGTVCLNNATIAMAYRKLISDIEPCPK